MGIYRQLIERRLKRLEPASSELTSEAVALTRRRLAALSGAMVLAGSSGSSGGQAMACRDLATDAATTDEKPTDRALATGYNNYAEFTTDKTAAQFLAKELTLSPWPIEVTGEVEKPFTFDAADAFRLFDIRERIYRFRCVEGWAMVVPWQGVQLCEILKRAQPTSRAKFVHFVSLLRPKEMVGQRRGAMEWPYSEGLRIDEAMHPLALMATGMYGGDLPAQNGGPIRLVVPWKYGFKSAKAITRIVLTETQPATTWQRLSPSEYGFYANVNPAIPHPRWSQSRENRLGEIRKRPTLHLNGYAPEVAELYRGMDPTALY